MYLKQTLHISIILWLVKWINSNFDKFYSIQMMQILNKRYHFNSQMFIKEAEVPMRLSHQNINKFLGIICDNTPTGSIGSHGIVYEYLENGDLNDFLDMFPLEWSYKLSLLLDVASGMNYLHSQTPPIIHGYLRTEHVLIGYNFKAKISV